MANRKGVLFVMALSVTLLAVVLVPDLRLNAQLAAARREGLWTGAADIRRAIGNVPEGDNAAPLVWRAVAEDRAEGGRLFAAQAEAVAVAEDKATPVQTAIVRRTLPAYVASLERWRAASERPRLDYHRRYEDGYRTLFPELAGIKAGATRLVAAAALGGSPRENLLAAARLSALVRQEPGVIPQMVGLEIGRDALHTAIRTRMGREVAAALGPDADARRILGPELPGLLDTFSLGDYQAALLDMGVKSNIGFSERFAHWGPISKVSKTTGVTGWRRLWARLPEDGKDLDAAATAVDAEMPALDALTPTVADVMDRLSGGKGRGGVLRNIAAFERERRAILAP